MIRESNHLAFLIAVLLAAVYTACGSRPAASTKPTTPVAIADSSATVTQPPTLTHLPIKTPAVTLAPTAEPKPTQVNIETWSAESPDSHWTVEGMRQESFGEPCEIRTSLTVANQDDQIEWQVWDGQQNCGLGSTDPIVFRWSADGQRLYFTNAPRVDGCAPFVNGSDMYQVNLNTGEIKQIVPEVGLSLALSPDETQLAYIAYGQRGLVIRDLTTGLERESALPTGAQAGRLVWSPDGSALAFTLDEQTCSGIYSIIRVDAATLERQSLNENDERGLETVSWLDPDSIALTDKDGRQWWLEVETGKSTPALGMP